MRLVLFGLASTLCACPGVVVLPSLGPAAVRFSGSTRHQNPYAALAQVPVCPGDIDPPPVRINGLPRPPEPHHPDPPPGRESPPEVERLDVLGLVVDTPDYAYGPRDYADETLGDFEGHTRRYWRETSYQRVDVSLDAWKEVLHMGAVLDDYFNRSFVQASLTSHGLSLPLTVPSSGASIVFQVRGAHVDEEVTVELAAGSYSNTMALLPTFQAAFDGVSGAPQGWIACSDAGGEIAIELSEPETIEGSFIRVKRVSGSVAGFDGPSEPPGGSVRASLTGKHVSGAVTLTSSDRLEIVVRDKDLMTRRFGITPGARTLAHASDLAAVILPELNDHDLDWVEAGAGDDDQVSLRLKSGASGRDAAIYVAGGSGLAKLGLDGPTRVDGVVDASDTDTVRGDREEVVAEALSRHVERLAHDRGIPVDAEHTDALDELVAEFDKYEVIFVEFASSARPLPDRLRAGAADEGTFRLAVQGDDFVYRHDVNAGFIIGQDSEPWSTWAHELGHDYGLVDLYGDPDDDAQLSDAFDYLGAWSLMGNSDIANHVDAWDKVTKGWMPEGDLIDVPPPVGVPFLERTATLVPVEYPFDDYASIAGSLENRGHAMRLILSDNHWIYLQNRQPGPVFS